MLTGCLRQFKDIELSSLHLSSVSPHGLRSLSAQVQLGVDNPARSFTLKDAEIVLKLEGQELLSITTSDLYVEGHCERSYPVNLDGRILQGANLASIITILRGPVDTSLITADVRGRISLREGSRGRKLVIKDLPAGRLIQKFKK